MDGLKALDGSLKLSTGNLEFGDFDIDNGALDARIDAGHLVLSANAAESGLSFDLELRSGETDLHHKGKLNLGRLIAAKKQQPLSSVPVAVKLETEEIEFLLRAVMEDAEKAPPVLVGLNDPDNVALFQTQCGEVIFSPVIISHMLARVAL